MVAQIDEQDPAVVANAMAPAGQTNALADVALPERAAGMGPVTMHRTSINQCRRIGRLNSLPEEVEGLAEAFGCGNRRSNNLERRAPRPEHASAGRLFNPAICLSWWHDGAFPLPEHLCGTSRGLFCPRCPDPGGRAPAGQAEPAAGSPARA